MSEAILSINAGSSSLKFSMHTVHACNGGLALCCRGQVDTIGGDARFAAWNAAGRPMIERRLGPTTTHERALEVVRNWIDRQLPEHAIAAAGHRVVHGGDAFTRAVCIDDTVLAALKHLSPLAPSHQPHNLAAIIALARLHPDLPQVACFDTAFHQTQPAVARAYALPRDLAASGVRRYGFHGLSYEYVASVLPRFAGKMAYERVVVAHLGHGASMCAMQDGRSVATTMGFTALDGLPMGQRCGALDPGVVPYLMRVQGVDIAEIEDLLYHKSGLLGVSGISDDMRVLLSSDRPEAAEAIDLFCYRASRELGSLAAALGGLDVLVFTGGIGEHAAPIRARICEHARWLGVYLDEHANEHDGPRLESATSRVRVFAIPTNEDLMVAHHTLRLVRDCDCDRNAPRQGAEVFALRRRAG
jgi:acetate kinase